MERLFKKIKIDNFYLIELNGIYEDYYRPTVRHFNKSENIGKIIEKDEYLSFYDNRDANCQKKLKMALQRLQEWSEKYKPFYFYICPSLNYEKKVIRFKQKNSQFIYEVE